VLFFSSEYRKLTCFVTVYLDFRISPRIFEKFKKGLFLLPEAWGKMIREKPEEKFSWHCLFYVDENKNIFSNRLA
jgi:hypothetical protein